ncbi:MAG: glycosyltransferase family 39 protein, partial [Actinobacteria bacterium]|nr:glycosyltransferase family 39 protein [Actinomycetota bacterium]
MSSLSSLPAGRPLRLSSALTLYRVGVAGLIALTAAVALWNAYAVPGHLGYDSEQNVHYAHDLVHELQFGDPNDPGENSYKPPGFFFLAGSLMVVGEQVGLEDPRSVVQFANALLVVATLALVLLLARTLWPKRRSLHLVAGAFFVFMPLTLKTAAMFHPGTLGMFLTALALLLAARMLERRRFTWRASLALLAVLLAGMTVMSAGVWTYGAVVVALLVAGLGRYASWREIAVPLAVLVGLTALVALPWYVYQNAQRGSPFLSGPGNAKGSLLTRKPLEFYTDLGIPEVVTAPVRPNYTNKLFPTVYTETWGDYFGIWAWAAETPPDDRTARELQQQSWIGLLPTVLGIGGWAVLTFTTVRLAARRRLGHAAAVIPALALTAIAWAGFLYYAVAYLS